ncbi:MAG: hypothetical protein J1D77_05165 [Muribaculaceae bacterium]|nr:hypothetical protein [Muribaculaceae bacterium]
MKIHKFDIPGLRKFNPIAYDNFGLSEAGGGGVTESPGCASLCEACLPGVVAT